MTNKEKKGVCECRSCKRVFSQSEIMRVYEEHLEQRIIDTVCPYCKSSTYGLIDYPVDEVELIFKNRKFYSLSNKRREYIDKYNEFSEVLDELYI